MWPDSKYVLEDLCTIRNYILYQTSTTRELLVDTLRDNGYDTVEFLLTPLQFGIPNSRLRYYLLAKATPLTFRLPAENRRGILRHIPGDGRPWTDDRKNANAEAIEGFLDAEMSSDEFDSLKIPDRVLEKWGRLFDIVKPSSRRTCCFTRGTFSLFSCDTDLILIRLHPDGRKNRLDTANG